MNSRSYQIRSNPVTHMESELNLQLQERNLLQFITFWCLPVHEEITENPLHSAACNGDINMLRDLLLRGNNSNEPNFRGTPPLQIAAENNQVEAVQSLLPLAEDVCWNRSQIFGTLCHQLQIMRLYGRCQLYSSSACR